MSFHSRQMLVTLAFAASLGPSSALSEPLAVFSPTEHDFGGVRRGEKVARTFQLRNGGDASLELTGVRFSMPGMTARLPGTVAPGADATIELELTTDHVQGRVRGVAVVETNDPRARSVSLELESSDAAIGMIRLPVHVLVKADVYANPDEIDFGEVALDRLRPQPRAAQFLEQTAFVKKRGGAFRLRGIRSTVHALEIRATPSSTASSTFRIDVGLRAEALRPGSLNGTIFIDTDDPTFPRLTIRVRGQVVDKQP